MQRFAPTLQGPQPYDGHLEAALHHFEAVYHMLPEVCFNVAAL